MARLLPWLSLVLVLMGSAAAAQQPQPPVREYQERQVVVPNSPEEPVPEVRVAANVATYLRFDAPIDRASVDVAGRATRFRVVDPGERTLTLEPTLELGPGEKLAVRVRYKDGASPAAATFALVSHPTLVDKEVEVVRRPRTIEGLEARLAHVEAEFVALKAQCAQSGLPNLAFSGLLDSTDVRAKPFWASAAPGYKGGLEPGRGTGYRARRWAMVTVLVRNLPGQPAWAPGAARLTSTKGTPVKVLSVHLEKPQLRPGESALVAVLVEPPVSTEGPFQLELVDAEGGRLLPITKVEL
ncbi:DUF2381 family protein [Cystobacter ferrugineus]|uniref:Uncharacterized protein n=1 Tax=Cystobacter ferrugineus TaxID=83449 RepID=A0A1L9BBC1_9BACT|nr:DUF2381 family protein [Cystobacter ferrugineus]OJH39564.1 hypothetical protein BON30_18900 [Cystobacter ferrugineus]